MRTCIGCFVGGMESDDFARFGTLVKLVVMFGCLDISRSCSGVGPLRKLVLVFTNKPCHRLAIGLGRWSGLESVSVSEMNCLGEST